MRRLFLAVLSMGCILLNGLAFSAEEVVSLPDIIVQGEFEEADFVGPMFTETNTKTKITENGMNVLGTGSTMSVQKTINLMPSVNQQSVDPFGLGDISNYHESFRFRGVEATGGGNPASPVNVENIPISGRPGGGANIYDMENFKSVSIYKGGLPADKSFGLTSIGGKIDMEVKRPSEEFSFDLKQAFGSYDARRSFLRLDTGLLPSDTAGFLSYSNTNVDKWKGEGHSGRNNTMAGLTQRIGNNIEIEAFSIYNNAKVNTYRPLSYKQVSSLDKTYNLDYVNDKKDYFYYDYNKNDFVDFNFFLNAKYNISNDAKINVKPFYWNDHGYYSETITMKNGQNRIRRWDTDHDIVGVLAEYTQKIRLFDYTIGYFYLEQEKPGPPTSWKLYKLDSGELVFDKWQILSNSSKHRQHAPIVSGKYSCGRLTLEGGVKYLRYSMPDITTYDATGIPDVSYEEALNLTTSIESKASAASKDFDEILPNFGLNYKLKDSLSCYFSYGRNFGMSVALYPYYISQKSEFYKQGITLQDLWNKQELEIADNFDIGLRYISEKLYVVPTIYYARHKNKAATYYDDSLGVSFPASIFDAEGYGFELEAGAVPAKNLSLYASFSYNRFYFSQNIYNQAGSVVSIDGNQVPDAPEFLAKALLSYRIGSLSLSPILRYTSSRYGDILQTEKVDDALIVDFDITYTTSIPKINIRELDVSLSFYNLMDKEYISIINTSDYQTLGSTYQTGAPFTVFLSAAVHF